MDEAQRLLIEQDCRNLVLAIAGHGDRREVAAAIELFVPDATWLRGGRRWTGPDEIAESYSKIPANRVGRHVCAGTVMTVLDEEHAEGLTYYVFFHHDQRADDEELPLPLTLPLSVGEWHDKFVRTAAGWKFASRVTVRVFERSP